MNNNNINNNNNVQVIIPPPKIKQLIIKTANFVRKTSENKGEDAAKQFEIQLTKRNKGNAQFSFLRMDSPYHQFYRMKIEGTEIEESIELKQYEEKLEEVKRKELIEKEKEEKEKSLKANKKEITLQDKLLQLHLDVKTEKTTMNKPPQSDQYTVKIPTGYLAEDIEIVKLTAQFIAINGRQFLSELQAKERHNPQFDFLKVGHPLFHYFTMLCSAYSHIVLIPDELLQRLKDNINNPQRILDHVLARRTWEEAQILEERAKAEGDELERKVMALIDWHDFVVVETINFKDEEDPYLPQPVDTIDEMNILFSKQELSEDVGQQQNQDMNNDMDDDDMDVDMDMDDTKETRQAIVQANMDRTTIQGSMQKSLKYQKCPICNELIPVEEISEHMRIELLDPKWKKQRDELRERKMETGLATNESISANLSRIARKRADIFIDTDDVATKKKKDAEEAAKAANSVVWDGFKATAGAAKAQASKTGRPPINQQLFNPPPMNNGMPPPINNNMMSMNNNMMSMNNRMPLPPPMNNNMMSMNNRMPPPPPMNNNMMSMNNRMPPPPPMNNNMIPMNNRMPPPPPMNNNMMPMNNGMLPPPPPPPPMNTNNNNMNAPSPALFDEQQPALKKFKPNDSEFLDERAFLSRYKGSVKVNVIVPNESHKSYKFEGQKLEITLQLTDSIAQVRDMILRECNVPLNKQNLRYQESERFLKRTDESLAAHNIKPPMATLELSVRGKRKKK